MKREIDTHYLGFEGEPEIQFIRGTEISEQYILRIWIGYFDTIMSTSKLGENGWSGLSYYYHTHTGWYETSPWEIQDINKAIIEFEEMDVHELDETAKNVWSDICSLLNDARSSKETVMIVYE